jgi:hypothetical protein
MKTKTIWNEVAMIAENLLSVYEQLVELSYEIEYIHDKEENAGDDLKNIVSEMMDELQKLKPLDY